MTRRKILLLVGVPSAILIALAAVVRSRSEPPRHAPSARMSTTTPVPSLASDDPCVSARSTPRPELSPKESVARASEEVRLRGTYRNYRAAVAGGNEPLAHALRPVLLRDRNPAIALAQDDCDRATTSLDREIARITLDSLRR
jgi:hypothetical protein